VWLQPDVRAAVFLSVLWFWPLFCFPLGHSLIPWNRVFLLFMFVHFESGFVCDRLCCWLTHQDTNVYSWVKHGRTELTRKVSPTIGSLCWLSSAAKALLQESQLVVSNPVLQVSVVFKPRPQRLHLISLVAILILVTLWVVNAGVGQMSAPWIRLPAIRFDEGFWMKPVFQQVPKSSCSWDYFRKTRKNFLLGKTVQAKASLQWF